MLIWNKSPSTHGETAARAPYLCPGVTGDSPYKGLAQILPVGYDPACSASAGWISQLPEQTRVNQIAKVGDSGHVKGKVAWCGGTYV